MPLLPDLAQLAQHLPGRCMLCHAWPAPPLCDECLARFARPQPRCATCALPVPAGVERCGACLREPPPLHTCVAAVDWAWPWTQCIGCMKFSSQPGLAAPLAGVLARADGVAALLAGTDALLPMPSSAQRMGERGYNPAL
ncbi:MAG: ComF family protein, partial [Ottowia sp.]|nr:ComF family protein [Ottowia sp.]